MAIKIILVDDHEILRKGLVSLLEKQKDMEVVGQAEEGNQALRLIRQVKPDIVVMDVNMPGLDGIDTTRRIRREFDHIQVIALSMYSKKTFVLEMLQAGASGYILKDCAFDELIKAINAVADGQTYLCSKITSIVLDDYVKGQGGPSLSVLTDKERQVLKLVSEGKPSKEVAVILGVSFKTVDARRRQIMKKIDAQSTADLVKFAIREGLTTVES